MDTIPKKASKEYSDTLPPRGVLEGGLPDSQAERLAIEWDGRDIPAIEFECSEQSSEVPVQVKCVPVQESVESNSKR